MDLDIPDFTDAERRVVASALRERYQSDLSLEAVDAEMRLDPESPVLTSCPDLYWTARGAHFVVVKLAPERYRAQFFYSPDQLYWTGHAEYESLIDCTLDILRAQADHERDQRGAESGADGGDLASDDE